MEDPTFLSQPNTLSLVNTSRGKLLKEQWNKRDPLFSYDVILAGVQTSIGRVRITFWRQTRTWKHSGDVSATLETGGHQRGTGAACMVLQVTHWRPQPVENTSEVIKRLWFGQLENSMFWINISRHFQKHFLIKKNLCFSFRTAIWYPLSLWGHIMVGFGCSHITYYPLLHPLSLWDSLGFWFLSRADIAYGHYSQQTVPRLR